MNRISSRKHERTKTLLAIVLTVGTMSAAFQGITQTILAAELDKQEMIATSYPKITTVSTQKNSSALPNGYVKPNYKLVDSTLEYFRDKKPTSLSLSREDAAEHGVQAFYTVFGLDMNGKTIEMAYNPAQNGQRAVWQGVWWIDGKKTSQDTYVQSYSFSLDAITGELYSVIHNRVLKNGIGANYDTSVQNNHNEYLSLAKKLAVELGAIKEGVKTVEYTGQGKYNNDPNVSFNVTGQNGDCAQLIFSRYDKELCAITYPAGMKETDIAIQNAEKFAARAQAFFTENPNATTYQE